jgi:Ras-related protein Rab-23
MTQRFAKNIYTAEYKKTLGVDFLMKKKFVKAINKEVEFMIWDTAGQEYYDAITRRYYKGACGAVLVFSCTNIESFKAIRSWYDKVRAECDVIPIMLVMNKIDLIEDSVVSEKDAMALASELKLQLFKASVKDNVMINEIFENLAVEFFNKGNKPLNA